MGGKSGNTSRVDAVMDNSPRLLRGGAFAVRPANVRSANRDGIAPSYRDFGYGFRPARTYP
jgi:formylglycine-generating enzyme required for sulfatase activity